MKILFWAVNDAVALRPLVLLVAPLFIVGHSCIFLARILDALPKMPGEWAASPPPHPSRKALELLDVRLALLVSHQIHQGRIQEALSRTKDDDERESFFLIVLEKVNNQGLTGPPCPCVQGTAMRFFNMPRACTAGTYCGKSHSSSRQSSNAFYKRSTRDVTDICVARCAEWYSQTSLARLAFESTAHRSFSEGVLVLFNLVSSEFQILMRT